jgi:hypothetical protein
MYDMSASYKVNGSKGWASAQRGSTLVRKLNDGDLRGAWRLLID